VSFGGRERVSSWDRRRVDASSKNITSFAFLRKIKGREIVLTHSAGEICFAALFLNWQGQRCAVRAALSGATEAWNITSVENYHSAPERRGDTASAASLPKGLLIYG